MQSKEKGEWKWWRKQNYNFPDQKCLQFLPRGLRLHVAECFEKPMSNIQLSVSVNTPHQVSCVPALKLIPGIIKKWKQNMLVLEQSAWYLRWRIQLGRQQGRGPDAKLQCSCRCQAPCPSNDKQGRKEMFVACQSQSCPFLWMREMCRKLKLLKEFLCGLVFFVWWGKYVLFTEVKHTGWTLRGHRYLLLKLWLVPHRHVAHRMSPDYFAPQPRWSSMSATAWGSRSWAKQC